MRLKRVLLSTLVAGMMVLTACAQDDPDYTVWIPDHSISDLNLSDDEILVSEYPLYEVYDNDNLVGRITEYRNDNGNEMIRINDKFIPYNKDFITKIDKDNKKIYMHDIGVFL